MKEEEKKEEQFDLVDELQKIDKPKKKLPNKYQVLIIIGIIIAIPLFIYFGRWYLHYSWEKMQKTDYLLKVDFGEITPKKEVKKKIFLPFEKIDNHYRVLYILSDYRVYSYYNDSYYKIDPLKGIKVDYQTKIKEKDYKNILKEIKEKEEITRAIVGNDVDEHFTEEEKYLIRHGRFYYTIKKEDLLEIFHNNHIILDDII